jgi:hypothetical protein
MRLAQDRAPASSIRWAWSGLSFEVECAQVLMQLVSGAGTDDRG